MGVDLVKYLQEKLDEIAPGLYEVSSERNINANYKKNQVVISALSGNIYKNSSSLPYQIDIVTSDIASVMIDFTTLARNNNEVSYTQISQSQNGDYQSSTITPFFQTPVTMEKDIEIGSNKFARLVVFATINETSNVNNIKSLEIDGEKIETLNASLNYTTELNTNRVSGQEMNKSKKKASSCSVTFTAINKVGVFFNKAFKVATGVLQGNTSFSVKVTLDNNLSSTFTMLISSYALGSERTKLPSVNIGLFLYDDRGDSNA